MTKLIDGKQVAENLKVQIASSVKKLIALGITPGIAVILVGDDPASQIYVRNKQRAAEKLGIDSEVITFPATVSEEKILAKINGLNANPAIDAILVQSPLPDHIDEHHIQSAIAPEKDVDGFHAHNVGALFANSEGYYPMANTPRGIMTLLKEYVPDLTGKNALVIGRSILVGRPMMAMLNNANATVTLAHRHTKNLAQLVATADVIIVAVGKPHFLKMSAAKADAVVIDVGINRLEDGQLVGDVLDDMPDSEQLLTPVPGGVGPMTIATLMQTTIELAQQHSIFE
ncbi:bifunctional 5,10-methylenetetrahydrofolate dehydrogenase/5,10-methenyltetrahydrofolate cyclohydrolase [Periweissella fabalis]|uniref:Bifunctional protein FolD n=1 Tax=Periweissella fabalis TaxID=1070421 RepID=A0A7X6N5G9_9LACO|nr:tetrahydrofolate dehydrogenase/cyclohydrolase catalytic domain-containing protein [Periweissella fabalis]MCM0598670.1 bifunctional methylenetetrahydrofolate dehydrogenase/methenyltetrahydrofolate cyclohydrolase [Periweissella fabalis]NKZ24323.1 bifunctional methylenetetrahydrofolate dehydrogenase/methenyltetrahydrofolate cyclohydrolase [Periweissella fabalis]